MNKCIIYDDLDLDVCFPESSIQSLQAKLNFRVLLKQLLIVMQIPLF